MVGRTNFPAAFCRLAVITWYRAAELVSVSASTFWYPGRFRTLLPYFGGAEVGSQRPSVCPSPRSV